MSGTNRLIHFDHVCWVEGVRLHGRVREQDLTEVQRKHLVGFLQQQFAHVVDEHAEAAAEAAKHHKHEEKTEKAATK